MNALSGYKYFSIVFFSLYCYSNLLAGEYWDIDIGLQSSLTNYSNSVVRKEKKASGFLLNADYLNTSGLTFVYQHSKIDYKLGIKAINQDNAFISFRHILRPDELNGLLTLKLSAFHIVNNDPDELTDHVNVVVPEISYLNYQRNLYLGLAYNHSSYPFQLIVRQWEPAIGIALNNDQNWLQLRGFFISTKQKNVSLYQKNTQALDISLTHFFDKNRLLPLNHIKANVLIGERIFAVDSHTATVYNLSDIQRGSISLSLEFQLSDSMRINIAGGRERFINKSNYDKYSSVFFYANLMAHW